MSPNRFHHLVLVALLTAGVGRAALADEQAADPPRPEARDYAVTEILAGLAELDPETDPIDTLHSMSIVAGASPQTLVRRVSEDGLWRLSLTAAQHRVFEDLLDGLRRGGPQQVVLTAYWLDLPSLEPLNHIDWSKALRFPDPASIATPAELAKLSGGEGASATVTVYAPYLAGTIPLGQSVELLDRAQREPDIKVLSSPKVTFLNGQRATIHDLS